MLMLKNPLMFTTTHDRIVAGDAKKLGEQAQLIAKLTAERDECKSTAGKVFAANLKLACEIKQLEDDLMAMAWDQRDAEKRIAGLETRLAPFIAERPRDEKGLFLSTKGAQA